MYAVRAWHTASCLIARLPSRSSPPEVTGTIELRERFIQESRSVAKFRHPNIVQVYAAGEKDGLLYFAMEFVPGESLRDRLTREGRLDEASAVNILHELGVALDHSRCGVG